MAYRPRLYLETSVVSYLKARTSRDLIAFARQEITKDWWSKHLNEYEVYVSSVVWAEVSKGDTFAAQERSEILQGFPILERTLPVERLAGQYVENGIVPSGNPADALHLAFASVYEMELLATWNFRHLANVTVRRRLRDFNHSEGLSVPIICTPEELLGE